MVKAEDCGTDNHDDDDKCHVVDKYEKRTYKREHFDRYESDKDIGPESTIIIMTVILDGPPRIDFHFRQWYIHIPPPYCPDWSSGAASLLSDGYGRRLPRS
jgi:hypothetical protein